MKKFLLSCAAVAIAAFSANAQLYLCGAANELGWEADAPLVVDAQGGNYTFTLTDCTAFKMSTAYGDWDAFNAAAMCIDNFTGEGEFTLSAGDGNILTPWKGDWTFVVNTDLTNVKVTTTTAKPEGFPKVYVRGGCNGWAVDDAWEFTTTDGVVYTFEVTDLEMVVALSEPRWKIADADWGTINFESASPLYINDDPAPLSYNAGDLDMWIDWEDADLEPITVIFNYDGFDNSTVQVITSGAGVENVAADNAPAVYYNLQGVRVNNPENGLFIRVQGQNITKIVK